MIAYDYLIVGAGLFGAVFAHEATSRGRSCLVIDRRPHIAGNAYTEDASGIQVHKYGAHIFHTSDTEVWDYVNKFATFNHYVNSPVARSGDKLYSLPFNMNTFYQLWGTITPAEAKAKIASQQQHPANGIPRNLEEQALSLAGSDIYETLIKGYTEKQWGRKCKDLPPSIIKRIPMRFTFDNNYFNDRYQGIPIDGYTGMVENMLKNCEIILDTDYKQFIAQNPSIAKCTIYTGAIDEFFDYCYGPLAYRSLRFETETLGVDNFQGNAVVNYVSADVPFTRIIEHKHFEFGIQDKTVITKEYPAEWKPGIEPYYPIRDDKNNELYQRYKLLASSRGDVYFGGRLGMYEYFDMDKVIASALELAWELL